MSADKLFHKARLADSLVSEIETATPELRRSDLTPKQIALIYDHS